LQSPRSVRTAASFPVRRGVLHFFVQVKRLRDKGDNAVVPGFRFGIKIRENAATKSGGAPYRAECSREKQKSGYRAWADVKKYGKRWAVEGVFSSVERIFFGETDLQRDYS
jgi:hypothetical protein